MENSEILSLFGTLPAIPLSQMFDYLSAPKLIMIALQFPEWKELCYNRIAKINKINENYQYLSLNVSNKVLEIFYHMDMGINMFSVNLKVKRMKEDFCCYRKEGGNLTLYIDCKNRKIMEELYVNIFNKINPSSIFSFYMNVNRNGKIERLKLLKRMLTGQTVQRIRVSGIEEDNIVDGNDLNLVVEAAKKIEALCISGLPNIEFNYGDNLDRVSVSFDPDVASEQFTTEYIKKINCRTYIAFAPIYGPENVNIFLHSWMSGGNGNVREMILPLCRDTNEEDIQKIFEGLDAKEWDPERREARFLFNDPLRPYSLRFGDLSGAKDLIRSDGTVGTLFIDNGTIKFVVWNDRFPWRNTRESIQQKLLECKEFLAESDTKIVEEVDKELSEVGDISIFTGSQCSKKSVAHKKIMDKMVIKRRIETFFRENADYLSTFED